MKRSPPDSQSATSPATPPVSQRDSQPVLPVRQLGLLNYPLSALLLAIFLGAVYMAAYYERQAQSLSDQENALLRQIDRWDALVLQQSEALQRYAQTLAADDLADFQATLKAMPRADSKRSATSDSALLKWPIASGLAESGPDERVQLERLNALWTSYRQALELISAEFQQSQWVASEKDVVVRLFESGALGQRRDLHQGLSQLRKALLQRTQIEFQRIYRLQTLAIVLSVVAAILVAILVLRLLRKARSSIDQSQAFSEAILDNMASVAVVLDAEGRIVRFNQAAQKSTGFTAQQLQGEYIWDWLITPEQRDAVRGVFENLIQNHQLAPYENEWLTSSGERRLFVWNNAVLSDLQGKVTHAIAIGDDITDQQRIQQELNRSRHELEQLVQEKTVELSETAYLLKLAMDAAQLGTWTYEFASNQAVWNTRSYEVYGLPQEQYGRPIDYDYWRSLIHPDDRALVEKSLTQFIAGEADYNPIYRVHDGDGQVRYIESHALLEKSDDGVPTRLIGVNRDISRQVYSELALKESHQRWEVSVEAAQLGTFEWRFDTDTVLWDERLFDLWRVPSALREPNPKPFEFFVERVHEEDVPRIQRAINALIEHNTPFRIEYQARPDDGSLLTIESTAKLIRNDKGEPVSMVGVNRDITLNKMIERDLVAAKEQADQANSAKSTFLANMSHEIRTPLNGVIGILQLLSSTNTTDLQARYLEKAYASARMLLEIINEILDFSKIEAGMLEMESAPFSLKSLMSDIKSNLQRLAEQKSLQLDMVLSDECPDGVFGDVVRLKQILLNLGSNAIKFTQQGSVTIRITPEGEPGEQQVALRFAVEDTGIGIDQATRDRIFERFTQADIGTTRKYGGTGLGLSISRSLLRLMHSDLNVDSVSGRGSCFWFVVQLERADSSSLLNALDVGAEDLRLPALDGIGRPLSGLRILVAEDNELNQEVVCDLLQLLGASAEIASNGQEALDILNNSGAVFDVVLMDMQMPELDGVEATRRLRQLHPITVLPVIALTANIQESDRQQCLDAGMNGFIAKPVSVDALRDTVQQCLAEIKPVLELPPINTGLLDAVPRQPDEHSALSDHQGLYVADAVQRLGGRLTTYASICDKFLQGLDARIDEINGLLQSNAPDHQQLRKRLHSLRGTSLTVGAVDFEEALRRIEDHCWPDQALDCDAVMQEISQRAAQLSTQLQHVLEELEHNEMA